MGRNVLDLTGQRFGMLTVLFRLEETKDRYYLWECVCDCGGTIRVPAKNLKRGITTNCGCTPKTAQQLDTREKTITGQRFEKLTAVGPVENQNGKAPERHACDSGETAAAGTAVSKPGQAHRGGWETKNKRCKQLDLTGKRFGRLIAVEATEKRDSKGSVVWLCQCDCGHVAEITADHLMHGNTVSCGCRKQEITESIGDKLTFVEGTCIERLRSRKHRRDNTSGFRGVYESKNGKWRVAITLKGKRYNCGSYDTFEEAKAVRLAAEKKLHDNFVLAWETWNEFANSTPEWAQDHPFIFEVCRVDGKLVVYAPILDEATGGLQTGGEAEYA